MEAGANINQTLANSSCLVPDTFPYTKELYAALPGDVTSIVLLTIACILVAICAGIFVEEMVFLYRIHNRTRDKKLTKVAVILGLYPVTIFTALISLLVPKSTLILDLISSCYLSVCFYVFVTLTINYFGGEDRMLDIMSKHKIALTAPPCCCCCCCILRPIILTRRSLSYLKMLSLQVAFIRPVLLFITIVLWADGIFRTDLDPLSANFYMSVITVASTMFSLYGTAVIVRGSTLYLQKYSLALKYWSFNLMVVLVNLQKVLFAILRAFGIPGCKESRSTKFRGSAMHNFILVIETFLLACLARKAYRIDESGFEGPSFPGDVEPDTPSSIILKQPFQNKSLEMQNIDIESGKHKTYNVKTLSYNRDHLNKEDSNSTLLIETSNMDSYY